MWQANKSLFRNVFIFTLLTLSQTSLLKSPLTSLPGLPVDPLRGSPLFPRTFAHAVSSLPTHTLSGHMDFGFRVCFPWWHPIIDSLYTWVVLGLLFFRALTQLEVNVRDCLINVWHPNYNKSSRRATSKSTLVLHIPRTHYHIWLRSMPCQLDLPNSSIISPFLMTLLVIAPSLMETMTITSHIVLPLALRVCSPPSSQRYLRKTQIRSCHSPAEDLQSSSSP